jgi:hypothetical protein
MSCAAWGQRRERSPASSLESSVKPDESATWGAQWSLAGEQSAIVQRRPLRPSSIARTAAGRLVLTFNTTNVGTPISRVTEQARDGPLRA